MKDLAEYLKADRKDRRLHGRARGPDTQLVYPVKNYGSGVTPFFTNLALWVAGFILMAMVKLRVDPEGLPKFTAVQAYFDAGCSTWCAGWPWGSSAAWAIWPSGFSAKVRRPSSAQGCSRCSWT